MAKKNRQYGSSNVLVRVYEKDLLTPEYFERILLADDYDEVLQILNETIYHKYLEAMNGAQDIEAMLTEALQDTFDMIFKISPSEKLNEYIALRYTYHNIKLSFKEQITGQDLRHLYFALSPISQSAIDFAVETGSSTRLSEIYLKSINEVREEFEEYRDLYSIDVILDRRFLQHLYLLAKEIGDSDLIEYTQHFIDSRNLIILLRAMKQGRTRNFLNAVLSSSGTIPKSEIIDLAQEGYAEVKAFYARTYLHKILPQVSGDTLAEVSLNQLEAVLDDESMNFMYVGKRVAAGPMPIIAFMHAKEVEVQNIRILLFAKSIGMDVNEIRERMRVNYVT